MGHYRDLRAWKAADEVAKRVFRLADQHWSPRHACVYDQLRRAALSVALNIVEGHASGPGARCRSHFRIALGSAAEALALLEFLSDLDVDIGDSACLARQSKAMCFRLWERSRR